MKHFLVYSWLNKIRNIYAKTKFIMNASAITHVNDFHTIRYDIYDNTFQTLRKRHQSALPDICHICNLLVCVFIKELLTLRKISVHINHIIILIMILLLLLLLLSLLLFSLLFDY